MGMFDVIRFDCDFISPHLQDVLFQTKDFYNNLDTYVVSKTGQLLLEKVEFSDVPEHKRPYFGTPEWDNNPFVRLVGATDRKVIDSTPVQYTGEVDFLGYIITLNGHDMLYKFQAGFEKGVLRFITVVEERNLENEIP
jgi:hypothetical protein